ncbi:MAG: hypothetical protein HKN23_03415 [Verrucomicrobiales bacterium]|nr:hypothetical protein [Verrucomicrobiales bacterium]
MKFKTPDGETRSHDLDDLSPAGREILAARRLELSLNQTWHPHDETFAWYWPKNWTDPNNRVARRTFLFAINRETGESKLFLQQRYDSPDAPPIANCRIRGKTVQLDLMFNVNKDALKLRSPGNTKLWLPVSDDFARVLLTASPALEGLNFEIKSPLAEPQSGDFTAEEFAASLEAIEIYRAWKSLVHKNSPLDPFAEPETPPEPKTAENEPTGSD